jgi:hypothetical protein
MVERITTMSEESRERNKLDLTAALARGSSNSAWARRNNVPNQTARRWSHEPEVHALIETCHRRWINQAVVVLARRVSWAAVKTRKLARGVESESVQLRATRAIFSDMMAVSKYSGLEERMTKLEARAKEQGGMRKPQAPAQSSAVTPASPSPMPLPSEGAES